MNKGLQRHTCEYLIIGGGPTGIGAACRLHELSRDWHMLESERVFGGLSASFVDDRGFTWDLGGHVLFSHYEMFDQYMRRAIPDEGWLSHQRESWIWIRDHFVPYPLQNNLHRLPPRERDDCVRGLLAAREKAISQSQGDITTTARTEAGPPILIRLEGRPPCRPLLPVTEGILSLGTPRNFAEWMRAMMGAGITDLFLQPYNLKVWAYPPEKMSCDWTGERVSVPSLEQIMKSIQTERDDVSWGPNQRFRFPKHGGTGSIWASLGAQLPANQVSLGCCVTHIDVNTRTVRSSDGHEWRYEKLISSLPLNQLLRIAPGVADPRIVDDLLFSTTHVIGVGIRGQPPEPISTKCWMYFPGANSPYYRVTVFSNYSPFNVPHPSEEWSLMAEVSESAEKPVDRTTLSSETIRALKEDRLLSENDRICSLVVRTIPQGYPTPFLGRDSVVDPVLRKYEEVGIFSRGRFGAWKYEVGNQDHSFAQGYECASRLAGGGKEECEPTLFTPNLVNAPKPRKST